MQPYLPHERLTAYQAAVTVARWVRTVKWPTGETALKDQAKRAADSVVLNIAEGSQAQGRNRPRHFTYAKASAMRRWFRPALGLGRLDSAMFSVTLAVDLLSWSSRSLAVLTVRAQRATSRATW